MVKEVTGGQGRSSARAGERLVVAMLVVSLSVTTPGVKAQVAGGQVISGEASIQQQGLLTTVRAGDQSVLRWDRFNLGAPETVQFIQPRSDSRVLNLVGGTGPSQIDGRLLANGQVYLMNPYGIYFGRTAVVETAGLFAIAGQIARDDFLAGRNRFTDLRGQVVNEGSITAQRVALAGQTVSNSGSIVAPDGFIGLAAGDEVLLGERGGRVFVNVGKTTPVSDPARAGVSNTGTIAAPRGRAVLAAGDLFSVAISNDGVVAGRDVALQGQGSGLVLNAGRIDASSSEPGTTGGRIEITGEKVGMMPGGVADASGPAGGGTVLVGGDLQGNNPAVRNAVVTYVAPGAELRADAVSEGDGGTVIVWADDTTRYFGEIFARGAGARGSGGFAEVSGRNVLDFHGTADLRAPDGRTGTLLLDPTNIYIADNAANARARGMSPETSGEGGSFAVTGSALDSLILTAHLIDALASANVLVTNTGSTGSGSGNITVVDNVSWSSTRSLTLNAANNIVVYNGIQNKVGGALSLNAAGAVTIDRGDLTAGNVTVNHAGALGGSGVVVGITSVALTGSGQVGSSGNPVLLNTPSLTVNKTAGAVFLSNGDRALRLTATTMLGGGEIMAGDVTLAASVNAGSSPLKFTSGAFDTVTYDITAGTLTMNNSGLLSHVPNGGSVLSANAITLQGAGGVYGRDPDLPGTIYSMLTNTPSVTLAKTGSATTFVGNRRTGGVTAGGSAVGSVLISAGGPGSSPWDQPITISGLTVSGAGKAVELKGGAITLTGGITSPVIEIQNSGALTGAGVLTASEYVQFQGSGAVGAVGTGNAINLNTSDLFIYKSGGAVYVTNGNRPLGLYADNYSEESAVPGLPAGGQITAGNVTIEERLNAGSSTLTLNTASLDVVGAITAGSLTINNSGPLVGYETISASSLTLTGTGAVGSAGEGNAVALNTPSLIVNKPAGALFTSTGSAPLTLTATSILGGGEITAGNVTLGSAVNAGSSAFTLNTGGLALGANPISTGSLTINNSGPLSGTGLLSGATSIAFRGNGQVGAAGTGGAVNLNTPRLTINKPGGRVFASNGNAPLDLGATAMLGGGELTSGRLSLTETANAGSSAITFNTAAFALGTFGVTADTITINNAGPFSGTGVLTAATSIFLQGAGAFGGPDPIRIATPTLALDKAGAPIFVTSGTNPLTLLNGGYILNTLRVGGGEITAGDLTIRGALNAGTSALSLNTGALTLTTGYSVDRGIIAGALTINNAGPLTGGGTISATSLQLLGAGAIGSVAENTPAQTNVTTLTLNKSGGPVAVVNASPLLVSGSVTNANASLGAKGTISVTSNLSTGTGTLRLVGSGGITQGQGSVITAGALAAINTGAGNIVLNNANAVGTFAALNSANAGTISFRSELLSGVAIGTFTAAGTDFPTVSGITTGTEAIAGGNVTLGNSLGSITINQPILTSGTGNGLVAITGAAVVNAKVTAAANTAVSISGRFVPPPPMVEVPVDTIINAPLTTGNATIASARDVIINAAVTATTSGGLSVSADSDNNGTGGVLVTNLGSLTANNLTGPLNILGSSLVNVGNVGGPSLGVGSAVYIQAGGAITTVQPVNLSAQSSAPAGAGIVVNGSGSTPAIATKGGGITFAAPSSGTTTLNGGSLVVPLLSASSTVSFGSRPVVLAGNTRLFAASTVFGGPVNGAYGLSLSDAATFGAAVGGSGGLASLHVEGATTLNADITTSGAQQFSGSVAGPGRLVSPASITFDGAGTIGAINAPVTINSPALILDKASGAVFVSNGNGNLALTAGAMPDGGAISAGGLSLTGPLNAGSSMLALSTSGGLALGANSVTADSLTITAGGALTGTGAVIARNLVLRGGGDVGSAGSALRTQSSSLAFAKAGGSSFITNTGPLAISGSTGGADANLAASGAISVTGGLNVGDGTLRLLGAGGVSQNPAAVISAGALGVLNTTSGDITLNAANTINRLAVENLVAGGSIEIRSDVAGGSAIGTIAAAGSSFPALSGMKTQGGDLSVVNTTGAIEVNQLSQSTGAGTGTVNISGATVNAPVAAAGGTTVTIRGNSVDVDTVVNSPITTSNGTISSTRDIIVNAPMTVTATGGLALTADSDNSGSGGVLVTSAGSVTANSLTAPLTITGSSIINGAAIGGSGLGVGQLLYIQSGGTIRTVQPVSVAAQSNAPTSAGIVLNGDGAVPAIGTTAGGITFSAPSSATITLNGASLTGPLLSASGLVSFGVRPVVLAGHTRIAASSVNFGGTVDGAFGLSLSGASAFGATVGSATPLASLQTGGATSLGGNITTTGPQSYGGAATLGADVTLGTTNSNVAFGSTLNSATSTARSLTVNAGTGGITVSGALGGTNPLNAVALNSTGATALGAVTASSLTTNAGGSSAIGGTVSAGTVLINDALALTGAGVTTTGNQTYASSVQVGANARFVSSNGSIAFRAVVLPDSQTANRQFEATALNGAVTATGDIGADANRFGTVLVNGKSAAVNNVFSTGSLALAAGTGANDVLEIMGSRISSTGGTVSLGSTPWKASAPMRASINKGNAGNLSIDGNQIVFQPYERMTLSGGDLELTGRTSVTLGTTSVSGRLVVTTPALSVYYRGPAAVDLASGTGMDNGIDIVASNVDFASARDPISGLATAPLAGTAFSTTPLGGATNQGRVWIATLATPVNAPASTSIRYLDLRGAGYAGTVIESSRFGTSAPLLSLVAAGSTAVTSQQRVLDALPGTFGSATTIARNEDDATREENDREGPTVPIEKLNPPLVDVELSAALREQLQNLGVFARPLNADERLARLHSLPFYDQVPRKQDARDRDYQVVDARISKESAIAAVAEWERQFVNPDTKESRVPSIAMALGNSYEAYRQGGAGADPAEFRRWLESRTEDPHALTALKFIRDVGSLFRQIEWMGLTGTELEVSKVQILFRILQDAPTMRAGFLRRVIEAGPAKATLSSGPANPRSVTMTEPATAGPKS